MQKRASGGGAAPHDGQSRSNGLPQDMQKRAAPGFSVEQFAQIAIRAPRQALAPRTANNCWQTGAAAHLRRASEAVCPPKLASR
jgi:hypothetical protein